MKRILGAVLALIMTLCGAAAAEREARRVETAADADEWIAVFLGDHPEELEGVWLMTEQMEAAAAASGGIGGLAKQLALLGKAAEIRPAYEGELRGYKAFYIPCVFPAMPADLILVVQDGAVAGLTTGAYSGNRAEETESAAFESIELALPVPGLGELPGVLTVPAGEGPFPVVVMLQGSGPCDMDETIGNQRPFRDIAEGLAEQGIAVYRFDKRTYAYGAETAADVRFTPEDEYIADAVNAVRLAAEQEKTDPDRVFLLGHSLGGNIVPAVARETERASVKVRGFIMMAASPRPLDVLMREQAEFLLSLTPDAAGEREKEALFSDLDRLEDPDSLPEDEAVAGAYAPYWRWLAAYDILQAAGEIEKPVLLLQGEEDYQVTTADYEIWRETFGNRENWRMISYPGLTHTFVPGLKAEGSAVYLRAGKVREDVILDIAAFIGDAGTDP